MHAKLVQLIYGCRYLRYEYVVHYLSDGYTIDWNEYEVPTKAYAIADTELGKLQQVMGKEIPFDYTIGWQVLFEVLQLGMMLASILVILGISVVFAQEGQAGMLPLLFTSQKGKETDAKAKITAASVNDGYCIYKKKV